MEKGNGHGFLNVCDVNQMQDNPSKQSHGTVFF